MYSNITFVSGLGATGSSALCDLFKEINEYYVMPEEFRLFVDPDGIFSLKSALVDNWSIYQSDFAIERFIKLVNNLNQKYSSPYYYLTHDKIFDKAIYQYLDDYINSLTDFKYNGLWLGRRNLYNIMLRNIFNKLRINKNYEMREIYVSQILSSNEFYHHTRKFIHNLVMYCLRKSSKSKFVFDEGYLSMNPSNMISLLPHVKINVVIRDPRGIYAESKKWSFIPNDLDKFIQWQKALLKRWNRQKQNVSSNQILEIEFENLVLDYNKTIDKIFLFNGISHSLFPCVLRPVFI